MNDQKAIIVLTVAIVTVISVIGLLWYLATEKTALTERFDPQPNVTKGNDYFSDKGE